MSYMLAWCKIIGLIQELLFCLWRGNLLCVLIPLLFAKTRNVFILMNTTNWFETLAVANNTFPLNPNTLEITFITVVPFVWNFPCHSFIFEGITKSTRTKNSPLLQPFIRNGDVTRMNDSRAGGKLYQLHCNHFSPTRLISKFRGTK